MHQIPDTRSAATPATAVEMLNIACIEKDNGIVVYFQITPC